MLIEPPIKGSDALALKPGVLPGDTLWGFRREAGVLKNIQLTAEALRAYAAAGLILPALQTFRFRTRAEAAGHDDGQVLEELDYATLFEFARVLVEFYREDPASTTEVPHTQELMATYDPDPAARQGYRTAGGQAVGDALIGLKLVKVAAPSAPLLPTAFVNQTSVLLAHNLGYTPLSQVFDSSGQLLDCPTREVDANTLRFDFSVPTSGKIILR